MELRQQLINDIEILPEDALHALSVVARQFIVLATTPTPTARPVYGSCKGKMWFADDFETPLEEMREYME